MPPRLNRTKIVRACIVIIPDKQINYKAHINCKSVYLQIQILLFTNPAILFHFMIVVFIHSEFLSTTQNYLTPLHNSCITEDLYGLVQSSNSCAPNLNLSPAIITKLQGIVSFVFCLLMIWTWLFLPQLPQTPLPAYFSFS